MLYPKTAHTNLGSKHPNDVVADDGWLHSAVRITARIVRGDADRIGSREIDGV